MPCASRRKVPGCVLDVRIACGVIYPLTSVCLIDIPDSDSSLAVAKGLRENCRGFNLFVKTVGRAPARKVHCDLSLFGPALFEIWWPDIYLGGPYGPVKDKMYWPELARRSETCAGPAGQCLCRGLVDTYGTYLSQWLHFQNVLHQNGSSADPDCGWAPFGK